MSALEKQVNGNHYKEMKIQPVEFIYANNIPFLEGNVIKYVSRWKNKNGIADLEKAKHYIELLIELETVGKSSKITVASVPTSLPKGMVKAPTEPNSKCPVPNDTPLLIHYRDSVSVKMVRPQMMRWGHLGVSMDIMYYEILEDNA